MIRRKNKTFLSGNIDSYFENKYRLFAEAEGAAADASGGGGDASAAADASGGGGDASAAAGVPAEDKPLDKNASSESLLAAEKKPEDDTTNAAKEIKLFAGKFKTPEEMESGYKELTKKLTESGKIAPEKYDLALPDGLSLSDPENDPLLQGFNEVAKKHGLSNEAFNDLVAFKLESDAQNIPDFDAEREKLGPNSGELISGLNSFLKAKLSDEEYNSVAQFAVTADNIKILDKLRRLGEGTRLPGASADKVVGKATGDMAEEAAAKARKAEADGAPEAGRLRREAERLFKEAYPE